MEITSSVVLPVTTIQMKDFSTWVQTTYCTYDRFVGAFKSPEMDTYIKTHILPEEMIIALRVSQPHVGEKWGDAGIQYLLLIRRRVTAKMKNLKDKVGALTFPAETAETRRGKLKTATSHRLEREANQRLLDEQMLSYAIRNAGDPHYEPQNAAVWARIRAQLEEKENKKKKFTNTTKGCSMEGDCAICMKKHRMTAACKVNCGNCLSG